MFYTFIFDSFIKLTIQTFPAPVVKNIQPKHTNEPNSQTTPLKGYYFSSICFLLKSSQLDSRLSYTCTHTPPQLSLCLNPRMHRSVLTWEEIQDLNFQLSWNYLNCSRDWGTNSSGNFPTSAPTLRNAEVDIFRVK